MRGAAIILLTTFFSATALAGSPTTATGQPEARCIPNFDNGKPAGYVCNDIQLGSTYDKLGLKNGDVIHAINGQPVSDPEKALKLLGNAATAKTTQVQVIRDGKKKKLSYEVH